MVIFKKLTAEHAELYRTVRLEALKTHPEAYASDFETEQNRSMDHFRTHLSDEQMLVVGGFDGDRLIAIASLHRESLPKMAHRATLTSVYVHPDYRGQQISRKIIEYMIDAVKETGVTKIYLFVMTDNEPAIRAYKKFGFVIYGEDRDAMKEKDGYVDEYLMVKYI
ncbi:GNAT family N-acetyltransferase [Sporolactobacillus kofuensis]|uniref:GNAT family N-acetyltransferase n=1 Tax=Sporolactobacillus kofuensis TaxID=269672 RepID=A0ABW1WGP8_9BACL|nr:GNAT family N-acetyltransferase [Sporolactobacillus kofuensis]